MAAFIDQLADSDLFESRTLSQLANLPYQLVGLLLLTRVGGNQFGDWNPSPRDPDRLALGDPFQQAIEMGFCVEGPDSSFAIHIN